MRRWALAALLLCALAGPAPTSADPSVAAEYSEPVYEDAIPGPPPVAERIAEIRRRVQDAVVYPERPRRRGVTGVAHIRFAIGFDGLAEGVQTVRSSGHTTLDRAAEQGARDAGRLPYVYGLVEIPIRFALEAVR